MLDAVGDPQHLLAAAYDNSTAAASLRLRALTRARRAYVRTHRSFFSALRSLARTSRCRDAGRNAGSDFCGV